MENSAPIVPEAPTRLWLPGLGAVDLRVRKVAKAVEEYDPSLRLARHEITGDWVVVIGDQGFPVYGFRSGRELPRVEDVERELGERDIKRNGKRIFAQIEHAKELQRQEREYRNEQTDGIVAEAYESAMHRMGATRHRRSLRKMDPKQRSAR